MRNLARSRGLVAIARAIDRLSEFVQDRTKPIDATFLKAFAELGDRCGLPRLIMQSSNVQSVTAHVSGDSMIDAIHRVAEEIKRNPSLGRVTPIDVEPIEVEFEVLEGPAPKTGQEESEASPSPAREVEDASA